jgi:hypothetical protein
MHKFVLRSLILSVLCGGAIHASTITWDFSTGTVGNVGSSTEIFTSGGFSVTANGFASNTIARNLFGKNGTGDEKGLGLVDTVDNELSGNNFIQLDLSALTGFTNFKIAVNSTTEEGWQVFNCSASGTVCATSLLTGTNEGTLNSISVGNVTGAGRYLDVKATDGNVLLFKLTADTASVPEPSTGILLLLSAGLLAGVRVLKFKQR